MNIAFTTLLIASLIYSCLRAELLIRAPIKLQAVEVQLGPVKSLVLYVVTYASLYVVLAVLIGSSSVILYSVLLVVLSISVISWWRSGQSQKKLYREAEHHLFDVEQRLHHLAKGAPVTNEKLDKRILAIRLKIGTAREQLKRKMGRSK